MIVLAGALLVIAVGVAIALGRGGGRSRPTGAVAVAPPVVALDASVSTSMSAPVAIAVDAWVATAAVTRPAADGGPRAAAVARDLAAAESARQGGKRLKQLALASQALELDPRNQRARYLLGDALITTGDQANGCRYLP